MSDPTRSDGPAENRELADFGQLVERYEARVVVVVSHFLDDRRDIEEAVQDTFVQAWRHRHQFRQESAVFTWLYRIATNAALMRLRRRRLATTTIDELGPADQMATAQDPLGEAAEVLDTVARVRAALADLPQHYRLVVLLRDVEGYSTSETAELLDLPVTTVKAHLHRGRSALRRALHP